MHPTNHDTGNPDAVRQYQVGNPAIAFIRQTGERYERFWQILRVSRDGSLAAAEGKFGTAQDALDSLSSEGE